MSSSVGVGHTGLERVWTTLKRHDRWYIANKTISVLLATFLAGWTLSYKELVYNYQTAFGDYHYTAVYWFLFIFYSF